MTADDDPMARTLMRRPTTAPLKSTTAPLKSTTAAPPRPTVPPRPSAPPKSTATRDNALLAWLTAHRRSLAVGVSGMVLGAILTCLVLVLFAPQPQAARPTGSGAGADATATLDDTFLSDILAEALNHASLPVGVSNVKAQVKAGNEIDVSGDLGVPVFFGQVARRLTAKLQLSVVDAALQTHIDSIDFGGLSVPGFVNSTLESQINAKLNLPGLTQVGGHTYTITSVKTTDGSVTLTLKRK